MTLKEILRLAAKRAGLSIPESLAKEADAFVGPSMNEEIDLTGEELEAMICYCEKQVKHVFSLPREESEKIVRKYTAKN